MEKKNKIPVLTDKDKAELLYLIMQHSFIFYMKNYYKLGASFASGLRDSTVELIVLFLHKHNYEVPDKLAELVAPDLAELFRANKITTENQK